MVALGVSGGSLKPFGRCDQVAARSAKTLSPALLMQPPKSKLGFPALWHSSTTLQDRRKARRHQVANRQTGLHDASTVWGPHRRSQPMHGTHAGSRIVSAAGADPGVRPAGGGGNGCRRRCRCTAGNVARPILPWRRNRWFNGAAAGAGTLGSCLRLLLGPTEGAAPRLQLPPRTPVPPAQRKSADLLPGLCPNRLPAA